VEGFTPGVALGPLRNRDERKAGDAERGQRLARRGELALAAVDQHQVGPWLVCGLVGPCIGLRVDLWVRIAEWIRALAFRKSRRRGKLRHAARARRLGDQPLEAAGEHLAHHAVIVAGR
jgi:hypothetical protein